MVKINRKLILVSIVVAVTVSIVGASTFVAHKNKTSNNSLVQVSKAATDNPLKDVFGEQITASKDYLVTIDKAIEIDNNKTLAVYVTVTNTSDHVVQLAPYMQLKLIGLYSGTFGTPSLTRDSTIFSGGPLAVGAKTSGVLYYSVLQDEQSELRFYPEVDDSSYVKLPIVEEKSNVSSSESNDDKTESQKTESIDRKDD